MVFTGTFKTGSLLVIEVFCSLGNNTRRVRANLRSSTSYIEGAIIVYDPDPGGAGHYIILFDCGDFMNSKSYQNEFYQQ